MSSRLTPDRWRFSKKRIYHPYGLSYLEERIMVGPLGCVVGMIFSYAKNISPSVGFLSNCIGVKNYVFFLSSRNYLEILWSFVKGKAFLFNRMVIVNWLFDQKNDPVNDLGGNSINFSWGISLGLETLEKLMMCSRVMCQNKVLSLMESFVSKSWKVLASFKS